MKRHIVVLPTGPVISFQSPTRIAARIVCVNVKLLCSEYGKGELWPPKGSMLCRISVRGDGRP